ncbi:MAG TPA: lipopolysaccharide assembly protein LapA domain-containing protein [Anaerolineales bacterium]|nr:lipopolysaccharide assembly protein LapA domain-containing protein [Anaerolineales bacterium]
MILILAIALILAVFSVIFALQNPVVVTATFFSFQMKGPLALFVLAGIGIGLVIGILVMLPSALKNAVVISRHRKQIGNLEKSLEEHKAKVAELEKPVSDEEPQNSK